MVWMNVATIALKGLRQRALSSALTSFSVALGVMLMVAVLVIYAILESTFSQRSIGYDLIVGPKGSPLQLVLSTVYHTSPPIENLPYRYYREFAARPGVTEAIPVAIGDTTEQGNFPIVGTIPRYFLLSYAPGREFRIKGRSLSKPFDALIGSRVAQVNGWDIGSKFRMIHGGGEGHVHDEEFTVVGLLAPTGTPNDKSVFVHLDGFYQVSGHDKPFAEAIVRERQFFEEPPLSPEELAAEVRRLEKKYGHAHSHGAHDHDHFHDIPDIQKEVTSILVRTKSPIVARLIEGELKKGLQAQAVNPIVPMRQLMEDVLGGVKLMLLVLTGLIIAVSGIGIFVSIYNSMAARKREIAIMRALGARRQTVFAIILSESMILCLGGGLLGLLMGHGLVFVAAPVVEAYSGIIVDPWAFEPVEGLLLPALLVLSWLAGVLPGMTAYRTDVAEALSS
jgi:putative ABC transport system permease protein